MMHLHDAEQSDDSLIEAVYDGIVEIPGWATFLDRACAALGVRTASLLIETHSLGHPERLRLFSSGAAQPLRERIDAVASESVFAREHDEQPLDLRAVLSDTAPVAALSISARIDAEVAFALGLWDRVEGNDFAEADQARCQALLPHLKRAMRVFVRYAQAYRERAVYQAVIERIGVGVALVDGKSAVMATNAIADAILAARNGLKIVDRRLTAGSVAVARVLESAVHAAAEAQTAPDHAPGRPLAIARDGDLSPLTVMIHPGPDVQPVNAPLRRSAIVVMRDPDRRASVSADVVRQLFGLTPAEAHLAALLAQGLDLDEAAAELGIRRNTARSQLQAVFMKTDVKRQSELVRMILSSVATLEG